ncbi:uncharacterized protein LOC124268108 [Haliotis rubra]|uniref:uncharacterized protein LOC124268108 n=1 Tax=Haliotis rubra TaxID=36100 RepID=UPI001EE56DDC|nr:uncharacterized protein LOC124268108 [Haliotis rubra]
MCVGSTTITCKNFEVSSLIILTCYMHQTTWFEFPTSVHSHGAAYNHYQRNCDWKTVTVGTGCRENVDCSPLTNAECVAGKCACNSGTRLVPRVNKCLTFQGYGKGCTADSDCYSLLEAFCLSGVCTCRHGYSYSPAGQYCRALKECTKFKDTFTTYPDSVILLHDVGSYIFSNPTKCKNSCINSGIFCKSADLSVLAVCFTSDVTWQEATGETSSFDTTYTHLQRDCDWS